MDSSKICTFHEGDDGEVNAFSKAGESALCTRAYNDLKLEASEEDDEEDDVEEENLEAHLISISSNSAWKKLRADHGRHHILESPREALSDQNLAFSSMLSTQPPCTDFSVLMQKEKKAPICTYDMPNLLKARHLPSANHIRKHPIRASCKPRYTSGTKDRHSKVATARGMRDRRVRLSPSCALNLFEIQEKLGFEQPSKAVEWLLQKAKHAIDELPSKLSSPNGVNKEDKADCGHGRSSDYHNSPLQELASPTSMSSYNEKHTCKDFPPKTRSRELYQNLSLSLCPMVSDDLGPVISDEDGAHLNIRMLERKELRAKPDEGANKRNSSQLTPSCEPNYPCAISRARLSLVL